MSRGIPVLTTGIGRAGGALRGARSGRPAYDDGYHTTVQFENSLSPYNPNGQIHVAKPRLPAGSTIPRMVVFYRGTNASAGGSVALYRTKLGDEAEGMGSTRIETRDNTGQIVELPVDIWKRRIRRGYSRAVRVNAFSSASFVHGVKVYHRAP